MWGRRGSSPRGRPVPGPRPAVGRTPGRSLPMAPGPARKGAASTLITDSRPCALPPCLCLVSVQQPHPFPSATVVTRVCVIIIFFHGAACCSSPPPTPTCLGFSWSLLTPHPSAVPGEGTCLGHLGVPSPWSYLHTYSFSPQMFTERLLCARHYISGGDSKIRCGLSPKGVWSVAMSRYKTPTMCQTLF